MEPREIAARVLELLGPNGERWEKGWTRSKGCECITSAANRVSPDYLGDQIGFCKAVLRAAGQRHVDTTGVATIQDVWRWHDRPETTFADVKRVLTQIASEP